MRQRLAVGMMILLSCFGCEEELKLQSCILNEIVLDEFNSLKYRTISGGRVYQLVQEFELNEEVDTLAYFQYVYFIDSLVVLNQLDPGLRPYMSVSLENDKPINVLRYFTSTGVLLDFDFIYGDSDLRINLTRIASNGDELFAQYANYHFDDKGNVVRFEQYGIDEDDRSEFVLTEDKSFTYDNAESPLEGLFLPFFANANVPSVEFFSVNNITAVHDENGRIDIDYLFNDSNKVIQQINPDGTSIRYGYLNCL